MTETAPIITAKDLNLWYGDFKALKDISLDVGEREITALIGPSGCGKSTFLKTLNPSIRRNTLFRMDTSCRRRIRENDFISHFFCFTENDR